jgi:hypothetical protein
MIERLGQVLYWGFAGLGVIIVLFGGGALYASGTRYLDFFVMCVIAGGVCWLIGRACLYVLSGR